MYACVRVIAKTRVIVFFNPSTAEADSHSLGSCHSNTAIFFGGRSDHRLSVIWANLAAGFQVRNGSPLVLLDCLDKPDEVGKVGWLKHIDCYHGPHPSAVLQPN